MQNFWIIGGGKFGMKAAGALRKSDSSHNLTIVEQQSAVCRKLRRMGFETLCMDGINYLERKLINPLYPHWIIPAIPLHVAYEWIRARLSAGKKLTGIPVPPELIGKVPHPIKGRAGQLFISIADFKCPDNCPEPVDICSHTGKPRPMILHEFLKSLRLRGFKSIVIRSHQLAPGVGGYKPGQLFEALKEVEAARTPVLLSTACSCHGVMDALMRSDK
jgi:hypothetical protein